jgi:hypothetical protein
MRSDRQVKKAVKEFNQAKDTFRAREEDFLQREAKFKHEVGILQIENTALKNEVLRLK